jgi:hypothetical protein
VAAVSQRGDDAEVAQNAVDHVLVAGQRDGHVAVDDHDRARSRAAGEAVDQLAELREQWLSGVTAAGDPLEAARVGGRLVGVGGQQALLQLVAHQQVAGEADDREGEQDRHRQAQPEGGRLAAPVRQPSHRAGEAIADADERSPGGHLLGCRTEGCRLSRGRRTPSSGSFGAWPTG